MWSHKFEYRISSNKNFRVRHLLEGGTHFKVNGNIHMKFQNFVIFSFQTTSNCIVRYILDIPKLFIILS